MARGQATPIQHRRSDESQSLQTTTMPQDKLPSYIRLLFRFRSARPSTTSLEPASDASGQNPKHLEASRSIFSSRYMQNRHRQKRCKLCFSSEDKRRCSNHPPIQRIKRVADRSAARPERSARRARQRQDKYGGAERDRTADPLLAKQVLSQLSYSPNQLNRLAASRQVRLIFQRSGKPNSHPSTRIRKSKWWARVDLNYRPHAYQACALTN